MNETTTPPSNTPAAVLDESVAGPEPAPRSTWLRAPVSIGVLAVLGVAALVLAWQAWQRVRDLEQEQAHRQQDIQGQSAEARMLAKHAQGSALEAAAKVALLEARVAEVAAQRGQAEDLLQSLSRARGENLLVDIESALLVSLQHSALVGSADPLANALDRANKRLARYKQPTLDGVRRAIARDLDHLSTTRVTDINALNVKLDDAVRLIDALPLLSQATSAKGKPDASARRTPSPNTATRDMSAVTRVPTWLLPLFNSLSALWERLWDEAKSLVRVTRIDYPEAVLMAPEQAFLLRENVKLRLLSARLALLSRQFDMARSDLRMARISLERYFDRDSRDFALALQLIQQVSAQAQQVDVPRPNHTLAALSAAAGR